MTDAQRVIKKQAWLWYLAIKYQSLYKAELERFLLVNDFVVYGCTNVQSDYWTYNFTHLGQEVYFILSETQIV